MLNNFRKLVKNLLFGLLLFLILIIGNIAHAQTPTPTPTIIPTAVPIECDGLRIGVESTGGVCLRTFRPFSGVASNGIVPLIASIFDFVFLVLVVSWVINLILILYNFISNRGDKEEAQKSWMYIQYMWQGTSVVLGGILVFSLVGIVFGAGTPFTWADSYVQCGFEQNQVIYRNAREEYISDPSFSSGDELEIGCCEIGDPDDGWKVIRVNGTTSSVPSAYRPVDFYCDDIREEEVP